MRTRHIWLLLIVVIVALSGVGCGRREPTGGDGGSATSAVTAAPAADQRPTTAPSPTSRPAASPTTPSPTPADDYHSASVRSLADLKSYRIETTMVTIEGEEDAKQWAVLVEHSTDPLARRTVSSGNATGDERNFEIIQIGDTTYVRAGDEWLAMSGESSLDEDTPDVWMLEPGDLADGGCDTQGLETMNGYQARHYRCDIRALTGGTTELAGLAGSILEGEAQVWLSTEFEIPVRSLIRYTLRDAEGIVTTLEMESNVTAINEPLDIRAPEGVEAAGLPEDVPLMEGATDVSSIMGMTTFTVPVPPSQAADWYREAMEGNGWEFDAEASLDEMMSFAKGDRTAMILLSGEGAGTSVTVMVEGE